MRSLIVLALMLAADAHAQCQADFDRSGVVEIHELVAAVNEALGGCGSAPTATRTHTPIVAQTPTRTVALTGCPVRFTDDNTADEDLVCWFTGSGTCGPFRFYTNGAVGVFVQTSTAGTDYFGFTADDATHATIFGRWTAEDASDFRTAGARLELEPDGADLLGTLTGGGPCNRIHGRYSERRFPPRGSIRAVLAILGER